MQERNRPETVRADGFRQDIQGLRAVAVLMVFAYHLWPDTVTGGFVGVDVFFVISGFLITAHLLAHPPARGRDLLEFWGRRIRRLLPAAFVVLAAVAVASRFLAPETRWGPNAGEIIASALYVENWVLAGSSVDYLAAAQAATPVQHYWSLSVEEQFYLLWPILILAIWWVATHARIRPIVAARVAMLAVVAGSLLISVTATNAEPASAYFITPTRVWELAAGGLVATVPGASTRRMPGWLAGAAAWLGLAMVLAAGAVISASTPFPGSAALLPVGGAALLIAAAARGKGSPTALLRLRPIQHLGDVSYSIYLWHWPLIVFWPYVAGPIGPVASAVIIVATIVLATATKVAVEDPFRFRPSLQPVVPTFRFAVVGMLVLSIASGAQLLESRLRMEAAIASSAGSASTGDETGTGVSVPGRPVSLDGCFGAASIVRGFDACPQDPAAKMIPEPLAAAADKSIAYDDNCWIFQPFQARKTCTYGSGDIRVALVGNSHAGQWLPTLQVLAEARGWTVTTFLISQCNATDATLAFDAADKTEGCLDYGRWVLDQTKGDAFDLVITSERQSVPTLGDDWDGTWAKARAGYESYLRAWSEAGTNLLVLRDTPFPGSTSTSVPDCLAAHPADQPACSGTPATWGYPDPQFDAATALGLPGIATLDVTRYLCTDTMCPAVIGSVVVYFDASHMTATYARSIAPFMERDIVAALARGAAPASSGLR